MVTLLVFTVEPSYFTVKNYFSVRAKYASADALTSSSFNSGACNYTLEEVEAIRTELYNIQQSLSTGEQEKVELMKNLACLKDDLTRLQASSGGQQSGQRNSDSSLDVSGSNPSFSTAASQTDLSGEVSGVIPLFTIYDFNKIAFLVRRC